LSDIRHFAVRATRNGVAHASRFVLKEIGFFYIEDHGISDALMDQTSAQETASVTGRSTSL
jgi:isopenicillin N synthase-like dioxygenase